jgi:hypothetical protein
VRAALPRRQPPGARAREIAAARRAVGLEHGARRVIRSRPAGAQDDACTRDREDADRERTTRNAAATGGARRQQLVERAAHRNRIRRPGGIARRRDRITQRGRQRAMGLEQRAGFLGQLPECRAAGGRQRGTTRCKFATRIAGSARARRAAPQCHRATGEQAGERERPRLNARRERRHWMVDEHRREGLLAGARGTQRRPDLERQRTQRRGAVYDRGRIEPLEGGRRNGQRALASWQHRPAERAPPGRGLTGRAQAVLGGAREHLDLVAFERRRMDQGQIADAAHLERHGGRHVARGA